MAWAAGQWIKLEILQQVSEGKKKKRIHALHIGSTYMNRSISKKKHI